MKLWRKILFIVLVVTLAIPPAVAVVVQIPAVQEALCDRATRTLNRSINGEAHIGSVRLIPFHTLIAGDVSLTDTEGDTLFSSRKVLLNVRSRSLISDTLTINRISIDDTRIGILRGEDSITNFEKVLGNLLNREDRDTSSTELPWAGIRLRKISISDLDLDLDGRYGFSGVNLALRNIVIGEGVYGRIHSLSFREKSGLEVENLSSFFIVSPRIALLKDFKYKDNYSDISIPLFKVKYGNPDNFSKYADSVEVAAVFDNSVVGLGSASVADRKFKDSKLQILIDGSINGKLSDFSTKDLSISTANGGTRLKAAAIIKGLPDIRNTDIRVNLKKSYTCAEDIIAIAGMFSKAGEIDILKRISPRKKIKLSCIAGGTVNMMTARANLNSEELGIVDAHLSTYIDGVRCFAGEVSATNVELGRITGSEDLGKVSAFMAGWAEMHPDSLRAEIVTAEISRLDFKGYRYSDISGGSTINRNHYKAELSSLDSNLYFKLMTDLTLGEDGTDRFSGSGNFSKINLCALNLSKMDTCQTRFMIDFDFTGDQNNNFKGQVEIRDMLARLGSEFFDLGHISLTSVEDGNGKFLASLESSMLSASYQGNDYLYGILSDAAEMLTSKTGNIIPEIRTEREKEEGQYGEFSLVTGDLKPISALLATNMYINPGTRLKMRVDNHSNLAISLNSGLLSFEDKFMKDMNFNVTANEGPIALQLTADMLQSGETVIDRDTLTALVNDNSILAGLAYNDRNGKFGNGKVKVAIHFPDTLNDNRKLYAEVLPSGLTINGKNLDISPSEITLFRNGNIDVRNFKVSDSNSYLYLSGRISGSKQDTIAAELRNFDATSLNFLMKKDLRLGGILNGRCRASALKSKEFAFMADFHAEKMTADGENLGDFRVLSKWDETGQKINCILNNTVDGRKPLNLTGSYTPSKRHLFLNADVNRMNIGWIDPLMVGVLDHTVGTMSGKLKVEGHIDSLRIASENMRLEDVHTNLSYTKVPYILDGPFRIDANGIYMTDMSISDTRGKSGVIKGKYSLKGRDKGQIDLLFDLKNIHALNTTFHDAGQGYYGNANATGKIRVFGPMKGLRINLDITTEDGTVHIPLDEAASVKKRDILTFVDKREIILSAYDSIILTRNSAQGAGGRKTGVKCNIRLKATPLTNLVVDINRANGDKASVIGTGQVEMKTGEGQFDIRGNYAIQEGNCHFSILGITAKDFTIQNGGTINFVGPVLQTDFKLAASYQTKASLETLFGDNKSIAARRTVNCIVDLTGKIDNPEIKFKIEVPDLEPTYKSMLDAALSTDEKNLRQGLALLISGGFIPDQQSGIVNNSTFLYSNASEIVSNQLSNIFHQLDIPIDLGFKYQPGVSGTDLFDVAISTQLFNNRVTINGSIGNKEYMPTGSATSDIVGNVDVGVKLNKTGQLKLNLFSHAADIYSNYLDQSQRNGAGITYQEEFATFKELWHKIFKRKRKQDAR